jgi:hypothetical protein
MISSERLRWHSMVGLLNACARFGSSPDGFPRIISGWCERKERIQVCPGLQPQSTSAFFRSVRLLMQWPVSERRVIHSTRIFSYTGESSCWASWPFLAFWCVPEARLWIVPRQTLVLYFESRNCLTLLRFGFACFWKMTIQDNLLSFGLGKALEGVRPFPLHSIRESSVRASQSWSTD